MVVVAPLLYREKPFKVGLGLRVTAQPCFLKQVLLFTYIQGCGCFYGLFAYQMTMKLDMFWKGTHNCGLFVDDC